MYEGERSKILYVYLQIDIVTSNYYGTPAKLVWNKKFGNFLAKLVWNGSSGFLYLRKLFRCNLADSLAPCIGKYGSIASFFDCFLTFVTVATFSRLYCVLLLRYSLKLELLIDKMVDFILRSIKSCRPTKRRTQEGTPLSGSLDQGIERTAIFIM